MSDDGGGATHTPLEGTRDQGGTMETTDGRRHHARGRDTDQTSGSHGNTWTKGYATKPTPFTHQVSHVTPTKTKTKGMKTGDEDRGGREKREENTTNTNNEDEDVHASEPKRTQPVEEASTVEHTPLATHDVVWVRVRGFPWWPAKVRARNHENRTKLETMPKNATKKRHTKPTERRRRWNGKKHKHRRTKRCICDVEETRN